MLPLLEDLADRILAGEFEPVACLEAPELVPVPERLRRSDGRPVYWRHMGTRYATRAHLDTEAQLLADAARERAPLVERERAAELLGSDSATLSAQLDRKPEAGSQERTQTGLRLDQAAAIWAALTNRQTSTVLTGPAGSGKTYTLAAAAAAARKAGVRHVYGTAASQAARNVLAAKLAEMGVAATVLNSTQFLDRVSRPATDRHRLVVAPGSLILVDEASMLPDRPRRSDQAADGPDGQQGTLRRGPGAAAGRRGRRRDGPAGPQAGLPAARRAGPVRPPVGARRDPAAARRGRQCAGESTTSRAGSAAAARRRSSRAPRRWRSRCWPAARTWS